MDRPYPPRKRYDIQHLEARLLLTIFIDGTTGDDTLTVTRSGNDLHITLNGSSSTMGVPSNTDVVVSGLGGNDNVTVGDLNVTYQVFGAGGDDTLTAGGGDVNHSGVDGVDGGNGTDIIILDDSATSGASSYDLFTDVGTGGTNVEINDVFPGIGLAGNLETIRVLANNSNNTVSIQDHLPNSTIYDIRGNGGNDTCSFERNAGVSTGTITFNGGSGTDELDYDDEFNPNPSWTLTSNALARNGATVASWSNNQLVQITGSQQNDTFDIDEVGTGIAVSVMGNDGDDTFNVGNGRIAGNILGTLDVDPVTNFGLGADKVVYNDALDTGNDTYTLQFGVASLTTTGLANAIDAFVDKYTLTANTNNDTIAVIPGGSFGGLDWVVSGNLGNDTLTYGDGTIRGAHSASLNGGTGTDSLIIDDSAGDSTVFTDKDYHLSAGTIAYSTNGTFDYNLSYGTFEDVNLNAGPLNNDFDLDTGLGGENTLNLFGGGGNDQLHLDTFATTATINFNGGTATTGDSIVVDDTADFVFAPTTYTLTKTTFDMTNFGLLNFSTAESFHLLADNENNTFNITGILLATTLTGGSKSETFNVGGGDFDTNISNNLTVFGEQGGDTLVVDDTTDPTGDDGYTLNNGVFTKSNVFVTLTYNFVEVVQVNGNPGNNAFNFVSPGSGALAVTLRGFNGSDTFTITPSSTSTVSVEGSDPTVAPGDVLAFTNAEAAGSATLVPNGAVNGTYNFTNADSVTFFGIETFPLPPGVPGTPDMNNGDDHGTSSTDNITNVSAPHVSGSAPPGVDVLLRVGTTTLQKAGMSSGVYSGQPTFSSDGSYALVAVGQDPTSKMLGPASSALNVTIDTVAPAAPSAPDLADTSDSGISTDNVTNDSTPTLTGPLSALTVVRLFNSTSEVGSSFNSSASASTYSITTPTIADGVRNFSTRFEDIAGNQSASGPSLAVTIDTQSPSLFGSVFDFLTAQDLKFTFTENVGASFSLADLTLQNITNNTTISPGLMAMVYSPNTATITFPGFFNGVLTDGNYTATLTASGITDVAGNPLAGATPLSFFALNGDANRDRVVNALDFNALAISFGQSGKFSQGNFNYDAIVNTLDFNLLAGNFNKGLAAPSPALAQSAAEVAGELFSSSPIQPLRDLLIDPPVNS